MLSLSLILPIISSFAPSVLPSPTPKPKPNPNLSHFANVRCNGSTIGTPTFGNDDIIYTVCAELTINAPIEAVYNTLLDFKNYYKWNSFVQNVSALPGYSIDTIPPAIGTKMAFTNIFPPLGVNMPSVEELSFAEREVEGAPGVAVNAWKSYDAAEHPNVLTDLGEDQGTRYVSYDSFYGALGVAILPMRQVLQGLFEGQGEDLRGFVEGL